MWSLSGMCFGTICLLWSCQAAEDPSFLPPPNIIWLVAEAISPTLGCYGAPLAVTPNIDGIAAQGMLFDRAYATAPICAPARSCLVTGLYATSMGTQHLRYEIPFSSQLQTLSEPVKLPPYYLESEEMKQVWGVAETLYLAGPWSGRCKAWGRTLRLIRLAYKTIF